MKFVCSQWQQAVHIADQQVTEFAVSYPPEIYPDGYDFYLYSPHNDRSIGTTHWQHFQRYPNLRNLDFRNLNRKKISQLEKILYRIVKRKKAELKHAYILASVKYEKWDLPWLNTRPFKQQQMLLSIVNNMRYSNTPPLPPLSFAALTEIWSTLDDEYMSMIMRGLDRLVEKLMPDVDFAYPHLKNLGFVDIQDESIIWYHEVLHHFPRLENFICAHRCTWEAIPYLKTIFCWMFEDDVDTVIANLNGCAQLEEATIVGHFEENDTDKIKNECAPHLKILGIISGYPFVPIDPTIITTLEERASSHPYIYGVLANLAQERKDKTSLIKYTALASHHNHVAMVYNTWVNLEKKAGVKIEQGQFNTLLYAATYDLPAAQFELANIYKRGIYGLTADEGLAKYWHNRAIKTSKKDSIAGPTNERI